MADAGRQRKGVIVNAPEHFSGSYRGGDVAFLLTRIEMTPMNDIAEKERLIQSGKRHYSELISVERQPTPRYLRLFRAAVESHLDSMARDLIRLGQVIRRARPDGIVLVSLARAGTPVGVALRRLYQEQFGIEVPHYSISIIRDRGIDTVALDHIRARHPSHQITFVDGWTGKGAITGELRRCLPAYNASRACRLAPELFVLADLAGCSAGCGSTDDYLIPSSILNATVSGLVSRTILNEQISDGQFHGCLYYEHLEAQDLSNWFIDTLMDRVRALWSAVADAAPTPDLASAAQRSQQLVNALMAQFDVRDRNYIKPGIGESTRSLMRRAPRALCLRDAGDADVQHLLLLAQEGNVPVLVQRDLPLKAAAIIKDLGHG